MCTCKSFSHLESVTVIVVERDSTMYFVTQMFIKTDGIFVCLLNKKIDILRFFHFCKLHLHLSHQSAAKIPSSELCFNRDGRDVPKNSFHTPIKLSQRVPAKLSFEFRNYAQMRPVLHVVDVVVTRKVCCPLASLSRKL